MQVIKMPKRPKISASTQVWRNYEKKMAKYVELKNEKTRRKGLKAKMIDKIKD